MSGKGNLDALVISISQNVNEKQQLPGGYFAVHLETDAVSPILLLVRWPPCVVSHLMSLLCLSPSLVMASVGAAGIGGAGTVPPPERPCLGEHGTMSV